MLTGPPTIVIHPKSQLSNKSINVTLSCEATGRGSIMYSWETKNTTEEHWIIMNNSASKSLNVGVLEQSQQYRCIVSNEVGRVRSETATITILGELHNHQI